MNGKALHDNEMNYLKKKIEKVDKIVGSENMSEKIERQGQCPKCGSNDLDYESVELGMIGDTISYPYTCLNCRLKGYECYDVAFVGHEY